MSTTKINVVSYNLLSSNLSSPDYYCHNDPDHLDPESRLELIKSKLLAKVRDGVIFCLQEVSEEWACDLKVFFLEHNYEFVCRHYGNGWNGYMGVAVAFSRDKYRMSELAMKRVSGEIPKGKKISNDLGWIDYLKSWVVTLPKPPADQWRMARDKWNSLLMVRLQPCQGGLSMASKKLEFVVGSYHMPCSYRFPTVMYLHALYLAIAIQKWSNGTPYILGADMNIKPDSNAYNVLTMKAWPNIQSRVEGGSVPDEYTPPEFVELRSAYEAFGEEPQFTNYVHTKDSDEFKETLDYIWVSKKWKVIGVDDLPECKTILPNESEPSDHLMIGACLELSVGLPV